MKLCLFMAISADGFIAKLNDDADWSEAVWDEYYKTVREYGNIIVGKRTFELMQEEDEFKKLDNPFTVVLSSSEVKGATVVREPALALGAMKAKGFNKVYLGGGAKTNAAFLNAKLIDEIVLDIEPVLLGEGIPLFSGTDITNIKLELLETKQLTSQTARLHYKVL